LKAWKEKRNVVARIKDYKSNHGENNGTNFIDEKHDCKRIIV
jgi:hypothetical protein